MNNAQITIQHVKFGLVFTSPYIYPSILQEIFILCEIAFDLIWVNIFNGNGEWV